MQNHIIHSQKVILEIPARQEAYNYQNTVSRLFNNGLQAAIEKVLDGICAPGEVVRINSLNLDLGEINAAGFEAGFKEKIVASLIKATAQSKAAADTTSTSSVIKQQDSQREAFIYFITHGMLPWYSNVKSTRQWEDELVSQWQYTDWQLIAQWLTRNPQVEIVKRLSLQFSNGFLSKFGEHLYKANTGDDNLPSETLLAWHTDLLFIHDQINPTPQAAETIWQNIFIVLAKIKSKTTGEYIVAQLVLKQLFANLQRVTKYIKNNKTGNPADVASAIKNNISQLLQGVIVKQVKDVLFNIMTAIENEQQPEVIEWYILHNKIDALSSLPAPHIIKQQNEEVVAGPKPNNSKTTNDREEKQKQAGKKKEPEDVLYINNCGLVLLHPFISAYFTDIGLLEKKNFINEAAQQRAILLLHYLATGETEAAEFNLVMQKVLCGYRLEDTLPAAIEITETEIEESKKMLHAVIDYWPPLKNTSIEGFQTTFLQRQGRLSTIQSGWLLRVEQKAVDILLGKLPWGFSTIRLPWMSSMMNVEWA